MFCAVMAGVEVNIANGSWNVSEVISLIPEPMYALGNITECPTPQSGIT